jgi:hypothetical protein
MKDIIREKYKKHGYAYFFKGLTPTVIRAFPVNAISLATFDLMN